MDWERFWPSGPNNDVTIMTTKIFGVVKRTMGFNRI